MTRRWIVTRPNGQTEDVGAEECEILDSGDLVFFNQAGYVMVGFARGQWSLIEGGYPEDYDEDAEVIAFPGKEGA